MNTNSLGLSQVPNAPEVVESLRIQRAIAQAQTTCQDQGPNSPACELTWDHALTLQLEQFRHVQGNRTA